MTDETHNIVNEAGKVIGSFSGSTEALDEIFSDKYDEDILVPARALSSVPTDPTYHPNCLRVGVRFNGEERSDIIGYDVGSSTITVQGGTVLFGEVEPFWRYSESRQERRRREAWEDNHSMRLRVELARKG